MVKFAELPAVSEAIVQETTPLVSPTDGVEQLNVGPSSCEAETNVIPLGIASVTATLEAASGPIFVTPTL